MVDMPDQALPPLEADLNTSINRPVAVQHIDLSETTFGMLASVLRNDLIHTEDLLPLLRSETSQQAPTVQPEQAAVEAPPAPVAPEPLPDDREYSEYDGCYLGSGQSFYSASTDWRSIPMISASAEFNNRTPILYVNGITLPPHQAYGNALKLSRAAEQPVLAIYNATEGEVADVLQAIGDKFSVGDPASVKTIRGIILSAALNNESLKLAGESHGALQIARALEETKSILQNRHGMSRAEAEQRLGNMDVETFGGASWKYTDGPRYIHYVNDCDSVPYHFGLTTYGLTESEQSAMKGQLVEPEWISPLTGISEFLGIRELAGCEPGRDAKIIRFHTSSPDNDWLDTHLIGVYLKHRQPFESTYNNGAEAQQAGFNIASLAKLSFNWLALSLLAVGTWRAAKKTKNSIIARVKKWFSSSSPNEEAAVEQLTEAIPDNPLEGCRQAA